MPLEELEDTLEVSEDDLYSWCFSSSLVSLSGQSSSKSLKISSLLVWSLMKVLIKDLALALHSFWKCPFFPHLKHVPDVLGMNFPVDLDFPFL